jgi:hypothetical protein
MAEREKLKDSYTKESIRDMDSTGFKSYPDMVEVDGKRYFLDLATRSKEQAQERAKDIKEFSSSKKVIVRHYSGMWVVYHPIGS